MSALGGQSSLDAMRQITKDLGIPTRRTARAKGVSYEAERILRTETSRTYSLAAFSQGQKVAEDIPGTQKRWMSTGDGRTRSAHLNAHGQTVGMNEKFKFSDPRGNYELMYPGDPAGPSYGTINERCRMIVIPPDFDAVELPVDKQVEKEQGKRERQAFKKKDEIALIEQGGIDIFADIRPPSGRAPRGRGEEYNQRRRIVSRIQTQMKYRSQAEQQLQQYRGQTSHRLRWRIDVAKTRVQQLNKSITAMLDIAGDPLAEDWGFKSELIDGIIDYTSELRVMAA